MQVVVYSVVTSVDVVGYIGTEDDAAAETGRQLVSVQMIVEYSVDVTVDSVV